MVRRDDTVLELGTGMGFLTNEIAQIVRKGSVHTFEANPKMVAIAKETLRLNKARNVEMYMGVIGDTSGTTSFYVNENFESSSLIKGRSTASIEVNVTPTGEILDEIRPNVVVMDIEGGEYELLKSPYFPSSRSIRVFIIEFHPVEEIEKCLNQLEPFFDAFRPSISLKALSEQLNHGPVSIFLTRSTDQN
jgi:FkbM family methyltransferase